MSDDEANVYGSDNESIFTDEKQTVLLDDEELNKNYDEKEDVKNNIKNEDEDNVLSDEEKTDEESDVNSIKSDDDDSDKEEQTDDELEYINNEQLDSDEKCYQKDAKRKKFYVEDKNLIISQNKWYNYTIVKKENRITGKKMTKYEHARIIGVRSVQLEKGAPALIEIPKNVNSYVDVAKLELYNKLTPFIIRRPLPNNYLEDWDIREMDIYIDTVNEDIL